MKLVYIYGPPGVGKLTVANEVAKRTGFRLFHNHLSIAAIEPVFDFGTETFWRLVFQLRDSVIAAAAAEDINILFTNVYEHPVDLPNAKRRFETVEAAGGEVCLVQLTCDPAVQEARLSTPDRQQKQKLTDVETLRAYRDSVDLQTPIPGRPGLTLDTTRLSPPDAAMRIIRHYRLMGDETA